MGPERWRRAMPVGRVSEGIGWASQHAVEQKRLASAEDSHSWLRRDNTRPAQLSPPMRGPGTESWLTCMGVFKGPKIAKVPNLGRLERREPTDEPA